MSVWSPRQYAGPLSDGTKKFPMGSPTRDRCSYGQSLRMYGSPNYRSRMQNRYSKPRNIGKFRGESGQAHFGCLSNHSASPRLGTGEITPVTDRPAIAAENNPNRAAMSDGVDGHVLMASEFEMESLQRANVAK